MAPSPAVRPSVETPLRCQEVAFETQRCAPFWSSHREL